jgi:hypothetical protein
LILGGPSDAAGTRGQLLKSQVITWDAAQARRADWGQMRTYFQGQTPGTKDVLVAVAVVEPGKALHRAHRHAQEEYLIAGSYFSVHFAAAFFLITMLRCGRMMLLVSRTQGPAVELIPT